MKLKVIGLVGALILAAPVAAMAAPASGITAQSYIDMTSAPAPVAAAVAPGDAAPKVEQIWWRGGGWGWRGRGFGWRGGFYGPRFGFYRRPFLGGYYGYRPFWRRRFWY